MTQPEVNFLKAAKWYEELKEQMDKAKKELQLALLVLPVNSYLQDPDTLLVYKITVPRGTFVEYQALAYERTKKPDEKSGSLSVKEAESKGFKLS
jgi:hypothetical protein